MGVEGLKTEEIETKTSQTLETGDGRKKGGAIWETVARMGSSSEERIEIEAINGRKYPVSVFKDGEGKVIEAGLRGWNDSFGKPKEGEDVAQFARDKLNLWLKTSSESEPKVW